VAVPGFDLKLSTVGIKALKVLTVEEKSCSSLFWPYVYLNYALNKNK